MIGWKFWNCWNWSHTKLDNPLIYRASKIRYSLFKLPSLVNPAPWKEWMGKLINGILKPTWGRWRRRWAAPPGWRCRPLPSASGQSGLQRGGNLLGWRPSLLTWKVPPECVHHGCCELLLLVPRHGQYHLEQMQEILRKKGRVNWPDPKVGTGLVRAKQQCSLLGLLQQQGRGVQGWVHLHHTLPHLYLLLACCQCCHLA